MSVAEPDEILVTRTVKDLVLGPGIEYTVTGVPDRWRLFAVTG